MRHVFAILVLNILAFAAGADQPWYGSLAPGTTRDAVRALAGAPSASTTVADTWQLPQGRMVVEYRDGVVRACTHFDPGGGAVAQSYYWSDEEATTAQDIDRREAWLSAGSFAQLPDFGGPCIRTARHVGACYQLSSGYLEIQPIITLLGGSGPFADKTSAVIRHAPGRPPEVLYRAIDHWRALRPSNLTPEAANERVARLVALAGEPSAEAVVAALGAADGEMGSGISYSLYWFPDGLLVVSEMLQRTVLERPGADTEPLASWLARLRAPPR